MGTAAIGTAERPLRVAIVGSGPSGLYAAEALLSSTAPICSCDVFDRMPAPFGLVRCGVAPDHQNIKKVIAAYEKTINRAAFRFFGGVKLGQHLTVDDLRACYDAIIYAVGCESDTKLGIPGEDLPGVHSATEFVGWYNGHPDHVNNKFNLGVEAALVAGVGNVSMDVSRILARTADELAVYDMPAYAIETLRRDLKVKTIHVVGRRGPEQANFSPKEIKELGHLENADLVLKQENIHLPEALPEIGKADVEVVQNLQYLAQKMKEPLAGKPRQIVLHFLLSPLEFQAGPDGRLARVKMERNALVKDAQGNVKARGTGEIMYIDAGLVFKAVGYRGKPVPGVPFDERKGHIPNDAGRVLKDAKDTQTVPGQYVVGWAKRGPSGLIGTNKGDSIATVQALLADFKAGTLPVTTLADPNAVQSILSDRKVAYVSYADWKRIDAAEIARGKSANKIREKFLSIEEMFKAAGQP